MISNDFIRTEHLFIHRNDFLKPDAERENLKATAIGKGWAGPVHKSPKTAGFIQDIGTGL